MAATHVSYEADGWGVGELWLEGDLLLQHELPRATVAERGSGHQLADRFRHWFVGEPDDFLDVAELGFLLRCFDSLGRHEPVAASSSSYFGL